MRPTRLVAAVAVLIALLSTASRAAGDTARPKTATLDKPAPDFTLTGIDGSQYTLSDYRGKYVVLEWNNPDCPFVRKHYNSGNMQALQKAYRAKDVVWLTINSSAEGKQGYYEPSKLRKRTSEWKWAATAYLRDPSGKVGRMYDAKTTPDMYVIDPAGTLIYAGAIDDKPSTRLSDVDGATNYVRACLDAAMAGKPVATKSTTPYGCSVKYAAGSH